MQYIKITFSNTTQDITDYLIAILSGEGYEGFEEAEDQLFSFISLQDFNKAILDVIANENGLQYEIEVIPEQNWNQLWESEFQPVIVDDFCTIRAGFHDIEVTTPFDIVITPKMSFGTGHHATTMLMMQMMRQMQLKGASVLDFGAGTGILAILAEMLGAGHITAIDIDPWPVENAKENIARNHCGNIEVFQGSLEDIPVVKEDIILANINRHILLKYMPDLFTRLKPGGKLLLSGLLTDDKDIIKTSAIGNGFRFLEVKEMNNWIALLFEA